MCTVKTGGIRERDQEIYRRQVTGKCGHEDMTYDKVRVGMNEFLDLALLRMAYTVSSSGMKGTV